MITRDLISTNLRMPHLRLTIGSKKHRFIGIAGWMFCPLDALVTDSFASVRAENGRVVV